MENRYELPLIALRGLVVFPDTIMTLDVGRDKSKTAVGLSMDRQDKFVFVVAQKQLNIDNPKSTDLYTVGAIARIIKVNQIDEGMQVVIEGIKTAKIVGINFDSTGIMATVDTMEYVTHDSVMCEAYLRKVREMLAKLSLSDNAINRGLLVRLADVYEPNTFINVLASEVAYKDSLKQDILETFSTEERLIKLFDLLVNEVEIAEVNKKIATRVRSQIDEGQKEYYLKEQIRAISKELGEDSDEIAELNIKIDECKMPTEIAEKAKKEVKKLSKMSPASPDASVSRSYLDWLTEMPWANETKDNADLTLARKVLDEDHFGLDKIKDRIIEYLAVMQLTKCPKGSILCFVGPPGVGKTSIVKSIARALGRKYARVSLGGVKDEAEIRGHRRTYVGALPGKVMYMMKQVGCINPVLLFDEIDKMDSNYNGDPASAMLEVLDPEQNNSFTDHYMEVPYDLSKVLFVCTANSYETIPAPLLDRMEVIELSGYSEEEKLEIAEKFLTPKQINENGLETGQVSITRPALKDVIEYYTRESGVRGLEREIGAICRKVALKIVRDNNKVNAITSDNLEEYLGVRKYINDEVMQKDQVGSATGLAWTSVGGTTLSIDATLFDGKGEVLLTGNLGDVMKESAKTAISLVRSKAKEYGIDPKKFARTDIHIHVPEGATPKDGPSAGVTMATVVMSAFSGRAVSKKVAMTGEITLRGNVLPIGGLKEKTLAAYRNGIRKIIIPKDNRKDIAEIPQDVAKDIEFVYADNIDIVLENALVK